MKPYSADTFGPKNAYLRICYDYVIIVAYS